MNEEYIHLSKQLLEERMTYVKYREEAMRLCEGAVPLIDASEFLRLNEFTACALSCATRN